MSQGVITIFKTLIKIPLIVLSLYFVLNVIAFSISYMRILSIANTSMYTAIENNFIPNDEKFLLEKQMKELESNLLTNVRFTDDTKYFRNQYGQVVKVGVQGTFTPMVPLAQHEFNKEGYAVSGMTNDKLTALSDAELEQKRKDKENAMAFTIKVEYSVPGLKYYPDIDG